MCMHAGNEAPTAGAAEKKALELFLERAPELTEAELEEINGLFRAFIFRRRSTGEYWTTCCRKHVLLERERTVTPEMRTIMEAEHAPEPESVGCYHGGAWLGSRLKNPHSKDRYQCPHCGAEVTVKELGRTGRRQNLTQWRRGVCLKADEAGIWAIGWWAKKSYAAPEALRGTGYLTELPDYTKCAVIRFEPGRISKAARHWWYSSSEWSGPVEQTVPRPKNLPFPIADIFGNDGDYGMGYDRIGMEALGRSPFRWCCIPEISEYDLLRLLAMACFYPRQMEMLHKAGFDRLVLDFAEKNKKNAWLLDWKAEEPKRFLRLPLRTLREATSSGVEDGLESLLIWQQNGKKDELEECLMLAQTVRDYKRREFVRQRAKRWGVRIGRILRYLEAQQTKGRTLDMEIQTWIDYLDAAEHLGLDLESNVIRMPKMLHRAHDSRCAAWAVLQERQREAADRERRAELLKGYESVRKKLEQRYAFEADGLRVLIPQDAAEIVMEGRMLKHCVGGYADRHLEGKTTILFLRRDEAPDVPYVTIEMTDGGKIRQAHGWKDEREPCELNPEALPPEKLHKAFFEEWLDWIRRGSPRYKDGKPKIGKKINGRQGAVPTSRKAG